MKRYTKKYQKGAQITSLDELVNQDFIYARDHLTHTGWFMNWQLGFAKRFIGYGWLFYAVKRKENSDA